MSVHRFLLRVARVCALGLVLVATPVPASATANSVAAPRAARPAAGPDRVVQVLLDIEASLTASRYSPITRVNARAGTYEFDCSGMASWVLRRAAPGAFQQALRRSPTGRLVARDFVRQIASVAPEKPSWGWARVPRIEDARPGDVIAWLKPEGWRSNVTGHVGFVMEAPRRSSRLAGGYLVRFADASRYQHEDDSRAASGRDGFGIGTILLLGHPDTGEPLAYGWFGDQSGWISETQIVIGRPRR